MYIQALLKILIKNYQENYYLLYFQEKLQEEEENTEEEYSDPDLLHSNQILLKLLRYIYTAKYRGVRTSCKTAALTPNYTLCLFLSTYLALVFYSLILQFIQFGNPVFVLIYYDMICTVYCKCQRGNVLR